MFLLCSAGLHFKVKASHQLLILVGAVSTDDGENAGSEINTEQSQGVLSTTCNVGSIIWTAICKIIIDIQQTFAIAIPLFAIAISLFAIAIPLPAMGILLVYYGVSTMACDICCVI